MLNNLLASVNPETLTKYKNINTEKLSSTTNINKLLFKLLPEDVFLGCTARNSIPVQKLYKMDYAILIVNLDLLSEPGSHFISLVKYKDTLFMFDSFGLDLHYQFVLPYLNKHFKTEQIWLNKKQYQSFKSNACGFFCIWFTLFFNNYRPNVSNIDDLLKKHLSPTKSLINEKKILKNIYEWVDEHFLCQKNKILCLI